MAPIPTFGFSAFIGMLFLNERPQRTKIKNRIAPSKKGGVDYHTPFRQAAHKLISQGKPLEEIVASMQNIKQNARRESAINGIKRLHAWQLLRIYMPMNFGSAIYQSPNSVFKIRFEPDLGLDIDGRHTAIHIWNNKADIDPTLTLAALTFLKDSYAGMRGGPDDWAVLSTKDLILYRHSEASENHRSLAKLLSAKLEKTFANVRSEIEATEEKPFKRPEDHPDEPF
ncbi:hypothetical protein JNB91_26835 [Rhizobium wenxiniae]|uniref:hypothetical protein n=1 Tax=Rhizobium wenxiniae TaxID=1737357 RepID=UPI001C6E63EE|nr:hypothetical protein [Rhizobium wenxiniae]MBW9091424.1 hypothetical protein [Rhizobium wenxiniae]